MILFFSGTGNSLEVARVIGHETGERLVDLGACVKRGDWGLVMRPDETLGLVFPTYLWAEPAIVADFLQCARFSTEAGETARPSYVFAVATYNRSVGQALALLDRRLREYQGLRLDGAFAVRSVGNYTPLYPPPAPEEQRAILEAARARARAIAVRVRAREPVSDCPQPLKGRLLSRALIRREWRPSTAEFHVDDGCIGCGRCADLCPTGAIALEDGRPRWVLPTCTRCLACLHRCPVGAIQCGKRTAGRPRYVNPVMEAHGGCGEP